MPSLAIYSAKSKELMTTIKELVFSGKSGV